MFLAINITNKSTKAFHHAYVRYCSNKVRVRFAPSPTGFMHLGGLRTALYNSLFAQLNNGTFILRIEDTDQTRIVDGAMKQIEKDLEWCGIRVDEGPSEGGEYGPYVQSKRIELYNQQIQVLLDNKTAYRCFCSNRRLDLLRKDAARARQIPKYDNRCRHLSVEEIDKRLQRGDTYCIRFKLEPNCETFDDMIYGNVAYDVALNEGDPVLMKADGLPTYHFANVVDDHFMKISHVLRGVEWQISTTKHILIYRAFKWTPPKFGHLPLLMNADGTKLSKRQGDITIQSYRENGILPLALVNFITTSGGGFAKDKERGVKPRIYSMDELIDQFDIEEISIHSGRLMVDRLADLNNMEIQRQIKDDSSRREIVKQVQQLVRNRFPNLLDEHLQIDDQNVNYVLEWSQDRITKLNDLVSDDLKFLWVMPDLQVVDSDREYADVLTRLSNAIDGDWQFDKEFLNKHLKQMSEDNNVKYGKFMKLLRTVLSGLKEGPSVAEMMLILGRRNTQLRLNYFLDQINKSN